MSTRARKASGRGNESSGGNVLFTLGLISVVALLIVGYVMTQGGVGSIANKASDGINTIFVSPTPTPGQAVAAKPSPAADTQQLIAQMRLDMEAKVKQEQDAAERRIQELKTKYESRINDLELRLKIMKAENERLRGGTN